MGTYLNPGCSQLIEALQEPIFVDKTTMLSFLNNRVCTAGKYVCVSRPRRFGKTRAADMICAYYGRGADARPLFERLGIASTEPHIRPLGQIVTWDYYLGAFDVIHVTLTDFLSEGMSIKEMITTIVQDVTEELIDAYPDVHYGSGQSLRNVMARIHGAKHVSFVVVIDEWDAPFRERTDDTEGQRRYIEFLRALFKDQRWIALAYMTGILPIKKYSGQSPLNMFDEYSMTQPLELAPFTGFTEREVMTLCEQYHRDFRTYKEWYDGYETIDIVPVGASLDEAKHYSIYSPLSVVKAVTTGRVKNWWNASGTFEDLADQINRNLLGLKGKVALLMDGERLTVNTEAYQNDMTSFRTADDVLTMLVHLGYLGFCEQTSEVFVPNKEVLQEFRNATDTVDWQQQFHELQESRELIRATWAMDVERVATLLEKTHDRADNKSYNSEAALKFSILNAYYAAQLYYTIVPELDSGKGYVDVAFIPAPDHPEIPALVVELKWNKNARTAIDQIHARRYPERLSHYKGNTLLVGISYERDIPAGKSGYKHHMCCIEQA